MDFRHEQSGKVGTGKIGQRLPVFHLSIVEDVIEKIKGIKCGFKDTSCPDQISKALEQYKKEGK